MSEYKDLFAESVSPDPHHELLGEQAQAYEKKDLSELHGRIEALVRTISARPKLKITTEVDDSTRRSMAAQGQDADEVWYRLTNHDHKTREVTSELVHIPKKIMESQEEVALGKAAHEAGHVIVTRYGEFVPPEVMQQPGFAALMAAVEERPTDQVVRDHFEGAGTWVDAARADSVIEGEVMRQKYADRLGYEPTFAKLCSHIVYEPHQTDSDVDPEVVEVYERIRKQIEIIEHTVPAAGAPEKEAKRQAIARYKLVYKKVWPEVQALVKEDMATESVRQMLDQALQGLLENIIEQLSPEERQELDDLLQGKPQDPVESETETKADGSDAGVPEEKVETIPDASETEPQPIPGDASSEEVPAELPSEIPAPEAGKETPVPMDQMSPELRAALDKIFSQLAKEKRHELTDKAREVLEQIEDEVVKDMAGQLTDTQPESHKEYHERREREADEADKRQLEEELKKQQEKEQQEIEQRTEALEQQKSAYDRVYDEIHDLDEALFLRLEEIFTPNIKREMRLRSTGSRINLPAVFRWKAQKASGGTHIDNRIFESLYLPEKKDYAITVLVDLSGSMGGEKITETFKAVVLLTEVLNRLGINFEIIGFQDEIIPFKSFDQTLNDSVREKIAGMPAEVSSSNPGGHNEAAYNDDGPCLQQTSDRLGQQSAKEKVLVVLSDGQPAGRRSKETDLTTAVQRILSQTDQRLIALGLGTDTEHVKKYYPLAMPNIDVRQLPEVLGNLLEDILLHPELYRPEA